MLNWLGSWNNATSYVANDAVTYNGSSYRSNSSNSGAAPDTNPADWTTIAQAGGAGSTLNAGGSLSNSFAGNLFTFSNTNTAAPNTSAIQAITGGPTVGYAVPPAGSGLGASYRMGLLAAASQNNPSIYGVASANGGVGIWGTNSSTSAGTNFNAGVLGSTVAPNGRGVVGVSSGTGGSAGAGGVFGQATGATGTNAGVWGQVPSTGSSSGYGVRGDNLNTSGGVGVYGSTASASGRGVISFGSFFLDNRNSPTVNGDAINIFGRNSRVASVNADLEWFAYGFTNISDRNKKENFAEVNTRDVLEKVAGMPITTWNFKQSDPDVRRMGPMAQDFHAAFGLNGKDDKTISLVDGQGVALAAIQGLNTKLGDELKQRDLVIEAQKAKLAEMESRVARLEDIATQSGFSLKQGANLGIGLGALVGLPLIGIALLRRRK